ncbi:MAG: hypothetical protein ACE5IR_17050 [bacterium]
MTISFTGFLAAVYLQKDKLFPKTSEDAASAAAIAAAIENSKAKAKIDSLTLVLDEILLQLQKHVEKTQELERQVEAKNQELQRLAALNEQMTGRNDSLEQQINIIKATEIKVEDLTKTLGAMKLQVLRPIVQNLSDEVIQILYDRAKNKDKQKIFSSLPPKRASQVLKHMTKDLN